MFVGVPNPSIIVPLSKLHIMPIDPVMKTPLDDGFDVLYNPEKYEQGRSVNYANKAGLSMDAPITQFAHGTAEVLSFTLFFDSMSAGAEVGGSIGDKAKMTANSVLPSIGKQVDVRDYTNKVYKLMEIDPDQHVPPLLRLSWGSLNFTGHLIQCKQTFTLFSETGTPLRAWVECTFRQFTSNIGTKDLHSPDVTKQRTIREGDSLWAMSAVEYSEAEKWREIARANGISNPRVLRSGDTVVLPALKK